MSDKLTAYIEAVERRAEAATPEPWEVADDSERGEAIGVCVQGAPVATVLNTDDWPCIDEDEIDKYADESEATAAFIAAARTDVPRLVRLVKALLAERLARVDGVSAQIHAQAQTDAAIAEIESQL